MSRIAFFALLDHLNNIPVLLKYFLNQIERRKNVFSAFKEYICVLKLISIIYKLT